MSQHPETYEEALEDAIQQEQELNEERKSRRKKSTPAKPAPSTSSETDRARAIVRAKLAAR